MVYFCKGKRIQQSTTVPGPFSAHIQTFMSIREKGVMQKEENFLFFSFKASMDMLLYITTTKTHNNNNRNNDDFSNTK